MARSTSSSLRTPTTSTGTPSLTHSPPTPATATARPNANGANSKPPDDINAAPPPTTANSSSPPDRCQRFKWNVTRGRTSRSKRGPLRPPRCSASTRVRPARELAGLDLVRCARKTRPPLEHIDGRPADFSHGGMSTMPSGSSVPQSSCRIAWVQAVAPAASLSWSAVSRWPRAALGCPAVWAARARK